MSDVIRIMIVEDHHVVRQGFRDGMHGFMTCALNTIYVLVERCKVWEKHYLLAHADRDAHADTVLQATPTRRAARAAFSSR